MLYIGHFSFSVETKARRKPAQPWHGHFTAVAEAANVSSALKKLEALVVASAETSELFTDVSEVFLEACVEIASVPRVGLLAHVALEEGATEGSISMTLPNVARKYATSYHLEPDVMDDDGAFSPEPFVVLKKKKTAAKPVKRGAKTATI